MNWSYTTTPSVPGIAVGASSPSGGATVSLTDFGSTAGGTSIPVIAYLTSSASTTPIVFNAQTYTLTMHITDNGTHDTGALTFTGTINGSLSATTSTLVNSFSTPSPLSLDGHLYHVSIASVPLAPPTSPQQNILAAVSVTNVVATVNPISTPEPTSLVLGGLGFSLFGLGGCWKRRRTALSV